ncbi:MAG: copper homeostasis protein CutC [Bacteroidales bacterium]|nr:copper homeostasis protein CutC [Bacteroidales bacterium]
MILEVCAGDIDSVKAAAEGGAARVELCSGLAEGGVTPSIGLIRQALKVPGIKVHVLIRPRGGDFLYTTEEVDCMVDDIREAVKAGVHGVVIGALDPDGNVDREACRRMVEAAGKDVNITFHRAFDLCRAPLEALEDVIALGCNRILTSGCAASALEGVDMLRSLVEKADGRLTILAGGGVSPDNARKIAESAGVKELHASARHTIGSPMRYRHEGVSMGTPGTDEYARKVTSPALVSAIVASDQ